MKQIFITIFLSFFLLNISICQTIVNMRDNNGKIITNKKTVNYNKTVIKYDSTEIAPADMEIYWEYPLHVYLDSLGIDSFKLTISIKNYGQETAINFSDSLIYLVKPQDYCYIYGNFLSILSVYNRTMPAGFSEQPYCIMHYLKEYRHNGYFFYKIHYTDKNGNKGILREIFDANSFTKMHVNLMTPDMTNYQQILVCLKEQNLW